MIAATTTNLPLLLVARVMQASSFGLFPLAIAVTFGYAALPALLIEHVTPAETGIANSVNSIARSVGMSLGTAFVITMLTRNLIPGAPVALPHESQSVLVFAVGAACALIAAVLVGLGLSRSRRTTLTVAEVEEEDVFGAAGLDVPADLVNRQGVTQA